MRRCRQHQQVAMADRRRSEGKGQDRRRVQSLGSPVTAPPPTARGEEFTDAQNLVAVWSLIRCLYGDETARQIRDAIVAKRSGRLHFNEEALAAASEVFL